MVAMVAGRCCGGDGSDKVAALIVACCLEQRLIQPLLTRLIESAAQYCTTHRQRLRPAAPAYQTSNVPRKPDGPEADVQAGLYAVTRLV